MNTLENATDARCSRRTLVKGAGAVGLGVALAQSGGLQPVAAQSESLQDILNITATTKAFGVTALGEAVNSARQGNYDQPIPAPVIAILAAARAQEQFHLEFFQSIGGEMLTDTFTVPPEFLTSYATFFSALADLETREVAAQVAAFESFTAGAGRTSSKSASSTPRRKPSTGCWPTTRSGRGRRTTGRSRRRSTARSPTTWRSSKGAGSSAARGCRSSTPAPGPSTPAT